MNPDITSDIFDNLSNDGDDQNIDISYYQNFMDYDMSNDENIKLFFAKRIFTSFFD